MFNLVLQQQQLLTIIWWKSILEVWPIKTGVVTFALRGHGSVFRHETKRGIGGRGMQNKLNSQYIFSHWHYDNDSWSQSCWEATESCLLNLKWHVAPRRGRFSKANGQAVHFFPQWHKSCNYKEHKACIILSFHRNTVAHWIESLFMTNLKMKILRDY